MKKIISLFSLFLFVLLIVGCSNERKLYILNVGDYMDDSLVRDFEEQFNCTVVYTEVNSNEGIYQKIKNESYDILVTSDYMTEKLYKEDLIQKIDFSRLPNYSFDKLFTSAQNLIDTQCSTYKDYFIPYFWGTVGILYRTDVEGLEDYVFEKGLEALFENNDYNKGMYNSARDALCMALMVLGEDINTDDEAILRKGKDLIKSVSYRAWGDDNLKSLVHNGLLDLAMVYSGDYLDESYQCEIDGEEVDFAYFAPERTNIWVDGLVITKDSKNVDLAYEFLNFMQDPEVQAQNSDFIGYCPLNEEVYNIMFDPEGDYQYDYEEELFKPRGDSFGQERVLYRYLSDQHYLLLNDLLEESKSK